MKFSHISFVQISAVFLWSSSLAVDSENAHDLTFESLFNEWIVRFDKKYTNADERKNRLSIWKENHSVIEQHNAKKPVPSFKLGHNNLSDLTVDEFQQRFRLGEYGLGLSSTKEQKLRNRTNNNSGAEIERKLSVEELPAEVDWVELGAVTEVKDQGACGSCWAFSAIGSLEGARFLKTGKLVSLSEQNLIDCDRFHDHACNGGLMDNAFVWDHRHSGVCTEADYPYIGAKHMFCKRSCEASTHTRVKDFVDVAHSDIALRVAINQQPISVAIQANQQVFQLYASGVFDDSLCGSDIDHGVLMVGYGTDDETNEDYYTIKNSWSSDWGEDGYIRLPRASLDPNGACGIYQLVSYPVL